MTGVKEYTLQNAVASYLDGLMAQGKIFWHHSPNEAKRTQRTGANLKRAGMKAGYPDCVIHAPNETFFIELKVKGKYLSKTQKMRKAELEALGYEWITIAAPHAWDAVAAVRKIMQEKGLT